MHGGWRPAPRQVSRPDKHDSTHHSIHSKHLRTKVVGLRVEKAADGVSEIGKTSAVERQKVSKALVGQRHLQNACKNESKTKTLKNKLSASMYHASSPWTTD